jgi:hypothetical protein
VTTHDSSAETRPQILLTEQSSLKTYLENQGCIFHDKRDLVIPAVDEHKVVALFGEQGNEVFKNFPIFTTFLQRVPITSSLDGDIEVNRDWRNSLPDAVRAYYENNNQLRSNNITPPLGMIDLMGDLCTDEELGRKFDDLARKYRSRFFGDDGKTQAYHKFSDEQKIDYVRGLEDEIVGILEIFS